MISVVQQNERQALSPQVKDFSISKIVWFIEMFKKLDVGMWPLSTSWCIVSIACLYMV